MNSKIAALFGGLAALSFVSACAPRTSLTKVWTGQTPPAEPLSRVMVLGLTGESDIRKSFETEAAEALQKKGVEAVPAYAVLSSTGTPSRADVQRAVNEARVDGVLVARVIGEKEKTEIVPADVSYEPLNDYVASAYDMAYDPGYVYQYDVVQAESKLFDKESGQLLWSAQSETVETDSLNDLIASMSKAVADDLAKKDLVSSRG